MTTTHQILNRRIEHLKNEDLPSLVSAPMQLRQALVNFEPSAEVAAWLTWEVGTRDFAAVEALAALIRQHNDARDSVLHQALDRLGVPTVDEQGMRFSVLGRLIELVAARGAA